MQGPVIHLICNAHLDPTWLWQWEEGAAEAVSTFRTAAELCEAYDGFVFNHNEAILYEWVREYEPELFERIRGLVKKGKWHIMGGWYLQPDCNMPSGESFVRQVLAGRRYFREHFDAEPTVAINFDPFGHSRGLVQILARSGYAGYMFMRPMQDWMDLPETGFTWEGFDGSQVTALRFPPGYNSLRGEAAEKVRAYLRRDDRPAVGVVLWGVGNHGGGPSRIDLDRLAELIAEKPEGAEIFHSTPEAYFRQMRRDGRDLPVVASDLNPWGVGCYSSQIRIKQGHRRLENRLYATEKMAAVAAMAGRMDWPGEELASAARDLMFSEFHDNLPGSSIEPVEADTLRTIDHGLEILSRVRTRAFFALADGQPRCPEGQIPILVYNPHPFSVRGTFECEFQLPDQNWEEVWTDIRVCSGRRELPSQVEKESCNMNMDWRKRVVFAAELAPSSMNRFDCKLIERARRPQRRLAVRDGRVRFRGERVRAEINARTGLLDVLEIDGQPVLRKGGCRPLVVHDDGDPWGMRTRSFSRIEGAFKALKATEAARFAGVEADRLPAVRVVEDGEVRSVVEALMGYGDSRLVLRYVLPKLDGRVGVEVEVHWQQKDRMLKLSLPTPWADGQFLAQVAYGAQPLPENGDEAVAQKWLAVAGPESDSPALTVVNDGTYAASFRRGELRLTLLRSPAYAAHPILDRPLLEQDRYLPRIDQGRRRFGFWLGAGRRKDRLDAIDREALVCNEEPMALSFFPCGEGEPLEQGPALSDRVVQLSALKRSEDGRDWLVRLFNPTDRARRTTLTIPALKVSEKLRLEPYRILTLRADETGKVRETDLIERPLD
jgi:alpha-mannosidase